MIKNAIVKNTKKHLKKLRCLNGKLAMTIIHSSIQNYFLLLSICYELRGLFSMPKIHGYSVNLLDVYTITTFALSLASRDGRLRGSSLTQLCT